MKFARKVSPPKLTCRFIWKFTFPMKKSHLDASTVPEGLHIITIAYTIWGRRSKLGLNLFVLIFSVFIGTMLKEVRTTHLTFNDSKLTIVTDVVLFFFFKLTFNIFHTFFYCFYCWVWTSKCELGMCDFVHISIQSLYFTIGNKESDIRLFSSKVHFNETEDSFQNSSPNFASNIKLI